MPVTNIPGTIPLVEFSTAVVLLLIAPLTCCNKELRPPTSAAVGFGCTVYVFDPFSSTNYTQFLSEFTGLSGTNMRMFNGKFSYKQTNKVTGIQIRCNDDNFTGGNIRTYGLRSTP